jgi:hypothetical protein
MTRASWRSGSCYVQTDPYGYRRKIVGKFQPKLFLRARRVNENPLQTDHAPAPASLAKVIGSPCGVA